MKGHIQVAKLLLSRGADVTHQTKVRLILLGTQVTLLRIVLLPMYSYIQVPIRQKLTQCISMYLNYFCIHRVLWNVCLPSPQLMVSDAQ